MPTTYVNELERKHKYTTRACTYYIKRITAPTDTEPRVYTSIRKMSEELSISDPAIRKFAKSSQNSTYIKSAKTGVIYLLEKPVKALACTARLAEFGVDAPQEQTFTSIYQLIKRFKLSPDTVYRLKKETPLGTESSRTVTDEFNRKYYITFLK